MNLSAWPGTVCGMKEREMDLEIGMLEHCLLMEKH